MRRAALVLSILVASCSDPAPAPHPAPPAASPQPAKPAPRAHATPPVASTPSVALAAVQLGPWTPSAEDLALAAALGQTDEHAASNAESRLAELPTDRKIAALRAGLRLADDLAARRAALLCEAWMLDAAEQQRASSLFLDALFDPNFTDCDGDRPQAGDIFEIGGSSADLSALLRRFAAGPVDVAGFGAMSFGLHKLFQPSHGRDFAALLAAAGDTSELEAWGTVCSGLGGARLLDADVVAVLSARLRDRIPGGVPDPAQDPLGAATAVLANADRLRTKEGTAPFVVAWATDVASRASPQALASNPAAVRRAVEAAREYESVTDRILGRLAEAGTPEAAALLRELADGDGHGDSAARLAALARAGDADAKLRLLSRLLESSGETLADALAAIPDDAAAAVRSAVLGLDDALADEALLPLAAVCDDWLRHPVDRGLFAKLADEAVARKVPVRRLVRLAAAVSDCRTRTMANALLERGALASVPESFGEDDLIAFLEAADAATLRTRLREAWDGGSDAAGMRLLALGDPSRAAALAHFVQSMPRDRADDAWILRLARTPGSEVRLALLELSSDEDGTTYEAAIAALCAHAGLAEPVADGMLSAIGTDSFPRHVLPKVREAAADGRPGDALTIALEAAPDIRFEDVADARNVPAVRNYLENLRARRETQFYAWATAELARLGDPAAAEETRRAIEARRYRWTDELSWRQWLQWATAADSHVVVTPGDIPGATSALSRMAELAGENCCARVHAASFFDGAFGADLTGGGPAPLVTARDQALRLAARGIRGWTWSRIAGTFVPIP